MLQGHIKPELVMRGISAEGSAADPPTVDLSYANFGKIEVLPKDEASKVSTPASATPAAPAVPARAPDGQS